MVKADAAGLVHRERERETNVAGENCRLLEMLLTTFYYVWTQASLIMIAP